MEGGGREKCWGKGGSSQSSHHLPTHRKNLPYKERVNSVYMPVVQLYLQTIILQVWQECTALSHYGRGCPPTNIPHSKHSPLAVFVKLHTKKQTELHPLRKAHNSQRHTHTHTHTHDSVNAHSVHAASFLGSCVWADSLEPGTHCFCMFSSPRISGHLNNLLCCTPLQLCRFFLSGRRLVPTTLYAHTMTRKWGRGHPCTTVFS